MLRTGLVVQHDGERFTVVEVSGSRILLQSRSGGVRQVDLGWPLSHPTTRIPEAAAEPLPGLGAQFSALSKEEQAALQEQYGHLLEVETGYRHGSGGVGARRRTAPAVRARCAEDGPLRGEGRRTRCECHDGAAPADEGQRPRRSGRTAACRSRPQPAGGGGSTLDRHVPQGARRVRRGEHSTAASDHRDRRGAPCRGVRAGHGEAAEEDRGEQEADGCLSPRAAAPVQDCLCTRHDSACFRWTRR